MPPRRFANMKNRRGPAETSLKIDAPVTNHMQHSRVQLPRSRYVSLRCAPSRMVRKIGRPDRRIRSHRGNRYARTERGYAGQVPWCGVEMGFLRFPRPILSPATRIRMGFPGDLGVGSRPVRRAVRSGDLDAGAPFDLRSLGVPPSLQSRMLLYPAWRACSSKRRVHISIRGSAVTASEVRCSTSQSPWSVGIRSRSTSKPTKRCTQPSSHSSRIDGPDAAYWLS